MPALVLNITEHKKNDNNNNNNAALLDSLCSLTPSFGCRAKLSQSKLSFAKSRVMVRLILCLSLFTCIDAIIWIWLGDDDNVDNVDEWFEEPFHHTLSVCSFGTESSVWDSKLWIDRNEQEQEEKEERRKHYLSESAKMATWFVVGRHRLNIHLHTLQHQHIIEHSINNNIQ